MNRYEVDDAAVDYREHPVLGPATLTLYNLMAWTDDNSDGWPYWQKPSRAAKRLMEVIEGHKRRARRADPRDETPPVTAADVRKAYTPIKAFLTRQGVESSEIVVPV